MKILLAPLLLAVSLPAFAEVDSKIHKLCVEAKDYLGCVRAMKGEIVPSERTGVGNKCQSQFAYIGNGNCQRVGCKYGWWLTGRTSNNSIVAGKSNWKCNSVFRGGIYLSGSLVLEEVAPVGSDENCPPIEPEIGWNSSCEKAPANWKEVEEAQKPECNLKLEKYDCSYKKYLDANPAMKQWAELNPDMAEQERIRLQSVD